MFKFSIFLKTFFQKPPEKALDDDGYYKFTTTLMDTDIEFHSETGVLVARIETEINPGKLPGNHWRRA